MAPASSTSETDSAGGIPARRRVERAIARAYGMPVSQVMPTMSGRCLEQIRLELSRAIGDCVLDSHGPTPCRIQAGGRRFVDEGVDFTKIRVLADDCLVLADGVARPIVAVGISQLLLDHDHAIPKALRGNNQPYRIVRPWNLSEWAVRCLCERYRVRRLYVDHWRAKNRGRHQRAVERAFRQDFSRFVENLLFAAEGVDYVTGQRRDPVDLMDRVRGAVACVYAHPGLSSQRKNLRTTLLRALAQRSQMLSLSFHLRADLPDSLIDIPD